MTTLSTPRPNLRKVHPLDALQRLRPVETYEQPMIERDDRPVRAFGWWELLGLLVVMAFGAAGVYAAIVMVMA